MKKRVLSLALAICMLVSILPAGMLFAGAVGETLEVVYNYEFKDFGIAAYNADGVTIGDDGFVDIKAVADGETDAIEGCAPWKLTNRSGYFRCDGNQMIFNGTANGTAWVLLTIEVADSGTYIPQVIYEGFDIEEGVLASAGNVYLTSTKVNQGATAMTDTYKVVSIPRQPVAGSYTVTADAALQLDAGNYYLWIQQDGTEGADVEGAKYRCVALDSFQLCKVALTGIEITGAPETMLKGETVTLTATAIPASADPAATWVSTNTDVATVENGVVTAVGAGETTIVAMSDENASITDRVTIKVIGEKYNYNFKAVGQSLYSGSRVDFKDANTMNYANAAAAGSAPWKYYSRGAYASYNGTDYYMNGTKGGTNWMAYTIDVAESGVYSAAMFYDTWTSSAPCKVYLTTDAVVTSADSDENLLVKLDGSNTDADGLVAKSNGTVTLNKGEYILSFVQYSDEADDRYVILKNLNLYKLSGLPLSSIEITGDVADVMNIGDKMTLTAETLPSDADVSDIAWTSSNENVVTVNGGVIEAVGMGSATITVTAGGKSDSINVTVGKFYEFEIQDFVNANNAAALLTATATDTADYGAWEYFYYSGTPSLNASSFAWPNVVTVGNYYAIKVNIDKTGVYSAQVISDTVTNSSDADLYISKAPETELNTNAAKTEYVEASLVDANKFVNVQWGGATGDVENMISSSTANRVLEAGEYVLWIKKEASYNSGSYTNPETGLTETGYKDRYFMIDAINLVCMSELSTVNGAAVRVEDPMGIRFYSSIPKSLAEDVVEYGTILLPTAMLGENELTCDTESVAVVKAEKLYSKTDSEYQFTAVLYNMPYSAYKTEITARAYAKLSDGSYIYGNTVARSIYQVAENGLASSNATAEEVAVFEQIIANAQ